MHFVRFAKTAIWASESDFWRFWDLKIHWGPALRAMFKISAFITCTFVIVHHWSMWLVETAIKTA